MTVSDTRGWQVTIGLAVASALLLGMTLCTMGLFLEPVMAAFASSNAKISQATTAFLLAMTLTTPILGVLIERIGARIVMTTGAAAVCVGYWLAARSDSANAFITGMAVAGAGVGASTYVPSTIVIASWIEHRRGLAMGVFLAATGVGTAVFPIWVAHRLSLEDWRATMEWIAIAIAIGAVPVLLALARTRPNPTAITDDSLDCSGASVSQALRTRSFWLMCATQVLTGLSMQGVFPYIVPHLQATGFSIATAAMLFGITNLTSIGGSLLFGALADRTSPKGALILGLVACGLSTPLLLMASDSMQGLVLMIAFAVLWGSTCALPNQLVPLLLLEGVGQRHFGSILGIVYLVYGVSMAAGPLVTGQLHDATDSYLEPFLLYSALMTLAALPVSLAGTKPRRLIVLAQGTPKEATKGAR